MSELNTASADEREIDIANDMLDGAGEIAKFLGKTVRQTNHLIATRQIPTVKIGGRRAASKARLRAHFRALFAS